MYTLYFFDGNSYGITLLQICRWSKSHCLNIVNPYPYVIGFLDITVYISLCFSDFIRPHAEFRLLPLASLSPVSFDDDFDGIAHLQIHRRLKYHLLDMVNSNLRTTGFSFNIAGRLSGYFSDFNLPFTFVLFFRLLPFGKSCLPLIIVRFHINTLLRLLSKYYTTLFPGNIALCEAFRKNPTLRYLCAWRNEHPDVCSIVGIAI